MVSTQSVVERVVLPLYAHGDEDQFVLAASVLASWLGAPLQLVAPDEPSSAACRALAGTLGVATEPVVSIESMSFVEGLAAHLRDGGPSVCVTSTTRGGLQLALSSGRATFLVAPSERTRMPSGPLGVELTGRSTDFEALATAAAWSTKLECGVRLVADHQLVSQGFVDDCERRLAEIGVDVGVDRIHVDGVPPLVLLGQTRDSTAIVIPQERVKDAALISAAEVHGVSVLVATAMVPGEAAADEAAELIRHDPVAEDEAGSGIGGLEAMDYEACLNALGSESVGRVGYVDDGWPTVVPVNYTARGREIFIRSHDGGKLHAARRGDVVCLEVDAIDESTRSGWSVVGHGRLEVITDPATLRLAWANDPSPWAASTEWHWLRLVPFSLSGRRIPDTSSGATT